MEKQKLFFIDAETDGLYGQFLTVGIYVVSRDWKEIDRAYYGIQRENMQVTDLWTRENVVPILGEYESCKDEEELLEKTWKFWEKYCEDAYAVADVQFPVECRLFEKCVMRNPQERIWKAPFPLLDLSTMLLAKGIAPLTDRNTLIERKEGNQHNALDDARMSADIFKKLCEEGTSC